VSSSSKNACADEKEMSTLQEIKSAIANLSPHDKALLTAELFAMNAEPDNAALEAALERGLKDVEAGRVRSVDEVKAMIPRWTQSPDRGQRHC
jgi:predicted transcriptional regulator